MNTPILQVVGYSGSGKTTFIKKLIEKMSENNINVATIKHDVHGLDIDKEGKDSYVFSEAGAKISCVSSKDIAVYKVHREPTLLEILLNVEHMSEKNDLDLIIIEGYSTLVNTSEYLDIKKIFNEIYTIGIARSETNKGFKGDINSYDILLTDTKDTDKIGHIKNLYNLNDIEKIYNIIINNFIRR